MKILLHMLCFLAYLWGAQEDQSERILGLRINGSRQSNFPVASLKGNPVTISFDVNERPAPDLFLRIYHCDRNWVRTESNFINDQFRTIAKASLPFTLAPQGVEGYQFSYAFRLPGSFGIEQFQYSGNYEFEIVERNVGAILARGGLFVAEGSQPVSIQVLNRQLPSEIIPNNQVLKIAVRVDVVHDEANLIDRIPYNLVHTVDVYKNRNANSPMRVDVDDKVSDTFVDGFGTPRLTFIIDDMLPGNEYRRLDLSDVDFYPKAKVSRARDGADVSRNFHADEKDHDGKSSLLTGTRYADYLSYTFELLREKEEHDPVYVVGDFSGWRATDKYRMRFDPSSGRYAVTVSLRRGTYDYEYAFERGNKIVLEGNDWRTVNVYTALVYYRDPRLGGYDRIIGFVQGRSSGGIEATSR